MHSYLKNFTAHDFASIRFSTDIKVGNNVPLKPNFLFTNIKKVRKIFFREN